MASFSTSHAWRAERALSVVRVMIALLLFIHGMARLTQGGVVPFGGWLESQGFPFGLGIACFVTG